MPDDILKIALNNFDETVMHCPHPVMIEFGSENYPGCRRLYEEMQKLTAKYDRQVRFGYVDVEEQAELAKHFNVGGLPCVIILQKGRLLENIGGALPLTYYKRILNRLLSEKKT